MSKLLKNGIKVMLLPLLLLPTASESATMISVDAQHHCLSNQWGSASSGTPAKFRLEPGRYVLSLVNNNMSCSYGKMDGCKITTLFVQGGLGTSRWSVSVTSSPMVIDVPAEPYKDFIAFVSDNYCQDNTGVASLLIQEAK